MSSSIDSKASVAPSPVLYQAEQRTGREMTVSEDILGQAKPSDKREERPSSSSLSLREWISQSHPPSFHYHSQSRHNAVLASGGVGTCSEVLGYLKLALPLAWNLARLLKDNSTLPIRCIAAKNILLRVSQADPPTTEEFDNFCRNDRSYTEAAAFCEDQLDLKNGHTPRDQGSPHPDGETDANRMNDDNNPSLSDHDSIIVGSQSNELPFIKQDHDSLLVQQVHIQCFPLMTPSENLNESKSQRQEPAGTLHDRLYALGLLFYELFSGNSPPSALIDNFMHLEKTSGDLDTAGKDGELAYDCAEGLSNNVPNDPTPNSFQRLELNTEQFTKHSRPHAKLHSATLETMTLNDNDNIDAKLNKTTENDAITINDTVDVDNQSKSHFHHTSKSQKSACTLAQDNSTKSKQLNTVEIMQMHVQLLSHLTLLTIPQSLRTVIANLLDCHSQNNDTSFLPDDAYHSFPQLLYDLHLMITDPSTFLEDVKFSYYPTLPLSSTAKLYGRHNEIEAINDAFRRNRMKKCGGIIIHGSSGVGKSRLAAHIQTISMKQQNQQQQQQAAIFVSGKFDQNLHIKPLATIASAFDDACLIFHKTASDQQKKLVRDALKSALGNQASVLSRLIPNLVYLLPPKRLKSSNVASHPLSLNDLNDVVKSTTTAAAAASSSDNQCVDSEKRIHYLFCIFVEMISSFVSTPFTLLLDDMQWADRASLALLQQLLTESKHNKYFFFAGCFRDNGMGSDQPMKLDYNGYCDNNVVGSDSGFNSRMNAASINLKQWLRSISALDVVLQKLHLSDLPPDPINQLISDTLNLFPRLTRPLSEVLYHKTRGNPLFLKRFLKSLQEEGLIYLSIQPRRWMWDLDKISDHKIPEDVVELLMRDIHKLSSEQQVALQVASCIGESIDASLANILSHEVGIDLNQVLEEVSLKGFMDHVTLRSAHRYRFVHDRVQQAAYEMIPPHERAAKHLRYGLAISVQLEKQDKLVEGKAGSNIKTKSTEKNLQSDEESFFIAVNQINHGRSAQNEHQTEMAVTVNLEAGRRSIALSDFPSAFQFFEHGVSYIDHFQRSDHQQHRHQRLRCNHHLSDFWKTHYPLALELYDAAAEAACVIGNVPAVKFYSNQILTNALCFNDKLNVLHVTVRSLRQSEMHQEVVMKASDILAQLGEHPLSTSNSVCGSGSSQDQEGTDHRIQELTTVLAAKGDEYVLNLKQMQQKRLIITMKLYQNLAFSANFINPSIKGLVGLRMVELTLQEGLCSVSPLAFANFGSYLVAYGDPVQGYCLGKLALRLLTQLNATEYVSSVLASVHGLISWISEPIHSINEAHLDGHKAGKQSGDVFFTSMNYQQHLISSFVCGQSLNTLRKKSKAFLQGLMLQNQKSWINHATPLYLQTTALINGKSEGDVLNGFSTNLPSEDDIISLASNTKNADVVVVIRIHQMIRSFLFRDYDSMTRKADAFNKLTHHKRAIRILFLVGIFYEGLISFCMAGMSNNKSDKWIERAKVALETLRHWSQFSSWNFENKVLLLEAEYYRLLAFVGGDDYDRSKEELLEKATLHYQLAIQSALDHKFIHEAALSYELAGDFHMRQSNYTTAMAMFAKSRNGYQKWGAIGLVGRMENIIEQSADVSKLLGVVRNEMNTSTFILPQCNQQEAKGCKTPQANVGKKRRGN